MNILIDIIWMFWVLLIGITEALIQIWDRSIILEIEEDEWSVKLRRRNE